MEIQQQVRLISIAAAVLAAVAAVGSWLFWFGERQQAKVLNEVDLKLGALSLYLTAHIDSPITASGGSLTFRAPTAPKGWTCSHVGTGAAGMNDDCLAASNDPYLHSDGVELMGSSTAAPAQAVPFSVTFYLRDMSGALSTGGGKVIVCSSANTPGSCSGSGYIQVQVFDSNSSLIYSNAVDGNALHQAVQYFDSTCPVHGTPGTPPSPILACEHPGYVSWPDGKQYVCRQGACLVFVDSTPPK